MSGPNAGGMGAPLDPLRPRPTLPPSRPPASGGPTPGLGAPRPMPPAVGPVQTVGPRYMAGSGNPMPMPPASGYQMNRAGGATPGYGLNDPRDNGVIPNPFVPPAGVPPPTGTVPVSNTGAPPPTSIVPTDGGGGVGPDGEDTPPVARGPVLPTPGPAPAPTELENDAANNAKGRGRFRSEGSRH